MIYLFPLFIYSLDRTIFEGKAVALTVPARTGQLQILAHHTPLISLLGEGVLIIEDESKKQQRIPIASGVLEVTSQEVTVLANF